MNPIERVRAAARRVVAQTRRGADRGHLEVQKRRLRRRIADEEALIGRLLYPEIAESRLEVDDTTVREAAQRIVDLRAELDATTAQDAGSHVDRERAEPGPT